MCHIRNLFFQFLVCLGGLNCYTEIHALLIEHGENGISLPEDSLPNELNSTVCGGLLVAKRGFIQYKLGENYSNNERCIWTIRTPKWQTSFLMHTSGFHSENDHLAVYVADESGILQRKVTIDTKTGSAIVGVIGPTVFLVLTTDQMGTGQGFFLEYFGFGYNELSGYSYNHNHYVSPTGTVSWPEKPVEQHMNMFSSFMVAPQPGANNGKMTFSVNRVDLMTLADACHHNYFSVHQLFQNGFSVRLRYCEADLLNSATISSSSPLLITYATTVGPRQTGISFSWKQ